MKEDTRVPLWERGSMKTALTVRKRPRGRARRTQAPCRGRKGTYPCLLQLGGHQPHKGNISSAA